MRCLKSYLGAAALVSALVTFPATAQMGGGGLGGPIDGMTNGTEDLVIPAGVRGEGRFSSFFVTDLWIKATGTG
ncbi:MAG: hypothetical protein KJ062_16675, partial [Thermoanaerobaculia bacterium]|nr:hypothetical protein [Thermoanaerobaculia bacterium]